MTQDPIIEDLLIDIDELDTNDGDLPSDETTLLARIPILAGSNRKAAYLAYRSTGFTVTQACDLAEIHISTVHKWRKSDLVFKRFEAEELQHLQESVGNDVIRFEFLRNMRMLLKKDTVLIAKGISDLEGMSEREYELFKVLRRFYTPADMLALEKVLHPEKHQDGPIKITLSWGGRLATREVDNDLEIDVVEGDYKELTAASVPGLSSANKEDSINGD